MNDVNINANLFRNNIDNTFFKMICENEKFNFNIKKDINIAIIAIITFNVNSIINITFANLFASNFANCTNRF